MDIPYGFDCYAFQKNEIKLFESNILRAKSFGVIPYSSLNSSEVKQNPTLLPDYIRFTRKNEHYSSEQIQALTQAGRLNSSDIGKQLFCGIKIQIGIGVVTNFLRKAMQYRPPNKGKSLYINGTWDGIVSGLTVDRDAPNSYDMMFGNFLAYDEEFPYMKFGPFFALESKLVLLTGSTRGIAISSFGTNIRGEIWLTILLLLLILSLLASFRVHWHHEKRYTKGCEQQGHWTTRQKAQLFTASPDRISNTTDSEYNEEGKSSFMLMFQNFFFIYFTMLLNKPSLEFDDIIWPRHVGLMQLNPLERASHQQVTTNTLGASYHHNFWYRNENSSSYHTRPYQLGAFGARGKRRQRLRKRPKRLSTSIRVLSYLWSAACLVMASIYSGELLAVILLDTDHNIDTITQLINSKPPIEPVIRQDDFTYNLMLKSLDTQMITLQNMTKIIPRQEVYTRRFIERVAERKQALLGDDELIETIYEIYHKQFPLYRSKVNYLQYPISIMYRKDLNTSLEMKLRRGVVQIFETGLIQRWYQAQKDTYIQFYDTYEKKVYDSEANDASSIAQADKYKPLSMRHFESFFKTMSACLVLALLVLLLEMYFVHYKD